MQYRYPDSQLVIFAKAPVPGKVKTRLIGSLTARQAAHIHECLLIQTVEMALHAELAAVTLFCHPDTSHTIFKQLRTKEVRLEKQQGKDLGERMLHALDKTLSVSQSTVLIGTDCPLMDKAYLDAAFKKLRQSEVVIGPAEDGGYVLVGQKRRHAEMFKGINWGSNEVLRISRQILQTHKVDWCELETLWDVDRPSDLERDEVRSQLHDLVAATPK